MRDLQSRIDLLEAELDTARETIRQLREDHGFLTVAPVSLRLTTSEASIFGVLLKKDGATNELLMQALYSDSGADDPPEEKIIDVFVCKMRKKIKPFGISITTLWGKGYCMPPESKVIARQLLLSEGIAVPGDARVDSP